MALNKSGLKVRKAIFQKLKWLKAMCRRHFRIWDRGSHALPLKESISEEWLLTSHD